MKAATLVPLGEYLSTSYHPDRDYIDGTVRERHLGERTHSHTQGKLLIRLDRLCEGRGLWVYPEQRIRVTPKRYRVPDLCVMRGPEPAEEVFTSAPFLCIEIRSKEDTIRQLEERISDYRTMGTRYVWLVDPVQRRAWIYSEAGKQSATILHTDDPTLEIPLEEVLPRVVE